MDTAGKGIVHEEFHSTDFTHKGGTLQLLDVNEALEKFGAVDARKAELVKLRYFVGMTFEERRRRSDRCTDRQRVVGLCSGMAAR